MFDFFGEHFSFIYDVIFVFDYGISYAYNLLTVDVELIRSLIGGTLTIPFNTFILGNSFIISFPNLGMANEIFSTLFTIAFAPINLLFDDMPLWGAMFLSYIFYGLVITAISKLVDILGLIK